MAGAYISTAPIADSSPGFSFGRQGNCNSGTYLLVDSVPSNLAGRIVPFLTAELTNLFIVCQNPATFTVELQVRNGSTFTTIHTTTVTNSRKFTEKLENVQLQLGDELCIKIGSGSCQNIVVGIVTRGNPL